MRLFLASLFALLFYELSAQHLSDTKQIFEKIDSQIISDPAKAREMISFLKKNDQSKEVLNKCNRLLVQAYYYENNYNDALQEIIQTKDQQNVEGIIMYRNVLYSAGIKRVNFSDDNNRNLLCKINEEILSTNELISQGSKEIALKKILDILPELTNENKRTFRDSFRFILINLSENDWINKFPEFRIPVLKIFSYYPSDVEFEILKKKLFIANVSDDWLATKKIEIDHSTNFQLRTAYYNLLQDYYFEKKNVSAYILNADQIREQTDNQVKVIMKARSQWIYLTEAKDKAEYVSVKKRGIIIVIGVILLSCIILILLIIKIRREKLNGKSYQLIANKLKINSSKKKKPQVISENVKLALLERLEKLESTNFFLDPNISIQILAKKLDSNSKYISEVINTYKNKNFTAYINEMRINYIKEKLNEEKVYRSYKIKYLAEESGFSSHSVFSSVFKSIEGVSPAQYIQLLK